MTDGPDEPSISRTVARIAAGLGLSLDEAARSRIVRHASRVLGAGPELRLTAICDPRAFLARHVGESLEGASLIDPATRGAMLDLGSGNGYPGLPIAAARSGLTPYLAEASRKKSAFLRSVIEVDFPGAVVLDRQIQRPADLPADVRFAIIVSRAMGNWERVVPRLVPCLVPGGRVLVWAGPAMESVSRRATWSRLRPSGRRALTGRERSWIWAFDTVM
ncbi:MAG TPA: RsmG family class I SAM-dependent methyltransferase [Candidatus Polarisedimenticolaceae bacterium]|nr:RsmG family class I SAM-dependent methyltransferase [Candidatus Polarisedimenticolaceae bacterium]